MNKDSLPIVGECVSVYVSLPCVNCGKFFEINAEKTLDAEIINIECPRCGYQSTFDTRLPYSTHFPFRIVREN